MYLNPSRSELVSADDLRLRISGLLPTGAAYGRVTHMDQIYDSLPRDPQVRVELSTVEIAPRRYNHYHFHNGTAIYILLQGRIELEFTQETLEYSAGDTYIEPIGSVHRAFNPHADIPLLAVGVSLTAPDRDPIVNLPGLGEPGEGRHPGKTPS